MEIHLCQILSSEVNMGKLNVTSFTNAEQKEQMDINDHFEQEENELHFEREQDFIQVFTSAITDEGCTEIINIHNSIPYEEEIDFDEETEKEIGPEEKTSRNLPWKYAHHSNIDYTIIPLESNEFSKIMEIMGHVIPNHVDFEVIQYMKIAHYKEGSQFPYHKDVGETTDTGFLTMTLNNEYNGGKMSVDRNTFTLPAGSILAFNNNTERWHGVEPIFSGERFALLMWFTFNDDPHPTNDDIAEELSEQS